MTDEQILQLFKDIHSMKASLLHMATKDDIAELRNEMHVGFDQIASRLDDDEVERAALESQINRHDMWIRDLAHSTKTKLNPNA